MAKQQNPHTAIFRQLFRPVDYLRIDQPQKRIVDWYIPAVVAVAMTVLQMSTRGSANVYGLGGLISMVLSFVQSLPGFYIAALAAIATFGRTDIDEIMPGDPTPNVETVTTTGLVQRIELTRRRFLCFLFAFLTMECIVLTLVSIVGLTAVPTIRQYATPEILGALHFLGVFVFGFILTQMLVATLWGLYYLGDRIHQPD